MDSRHQFAVLLSMMMMMSDVKTCSAPLTATSWCSSRSTRGQATRPPTHSQTRPRCSRAAVRDSTVTAYQDKSPPRRVQLSASFRGSVTVRTPPHGSVRDSNTVPVPVVEPSSTESTVGVDCTEVQRHFHSVQRRRTPC